MKLNDIINLTITDLSSSGEGVAKVNFAPFVVFVPLALVGEIVEAKITLIKKSFARAELIRVIKQSADRVSPTCAYFGLCGGCNLMHLTYEKQLLFKQQKVLRALSKIAGIDVAGVDCYPNNKTKGTRNKITLHNDGADLGLYKRGTNTIIEISNCVMYEKDITATLKKLRKNLHKQGAKIILRQLPENILGLNTKGISDKSFMQVNSYIRDKLYTDVLDVISKSEAGKAESNNSKADKNNNAGISDKINTDKPNIIIDAYCGVGILTSLIAKQKLADKVIGIEIVNEAHKDANQIAKANKAKNIEFILGDALKELPTLLQKYQTANTTLILDPPRTGVDSLLLSKITQNPPAKIIYISCNPATLARDLKLLKHHYTLNKIKAYDMFTNTSEVETMAVLIKR
ncbi:MAG: class I SAM-dependent RNA methyltransferase [Firmicutes bacterium]|nr:class I SAM-dependent RNA methyltransferase [Bacillota bacterium]